MVRWFVLIFAISIACFGCNVPGDATVRNAFLEENPGVEIVSQELIFEQDQNRVYSIKFKQAPDTEVKSVLFGMKRTNGAWRRCDDRTETKC